MPNLDRRRTAVALAVLTGCVAVHSLAGASPAASAGSTEYVDAEVVAALAGGRDRDALSPAVVDELDRRMQLTNDVFSHVEPFMEDADFGGLIVDQSDGGRVIFLSTSDRLLADARRGVPAGLQTSIRYRKVSVTEAELRDRVIELTGSWKRWAPGGKPPVSVGIDLARSAVVVGINSDLAVDVDLDETAAAIEASVGLDVVVEFVHAEVETACTSRSNCTNPLKPGILITSPTGTSTMGFHVKASNGVDRMFVGAGHIGNGSISHAGFGTIGSTVATLFTPGLALDADLIQMPDNQATRSIYGRSVVVGGARNPIQGEAVAVSLGKSNVVRTGTITQAWGSHWASGCGCYVNSSDASYTTIVGDSGSPVMSGDWAIGINVTSGGRMTPFQSVLGGFGAYVYLG